MKNSKTTVAAAILSFTLVGASSAFALGAGTGSPAANPAQAPVEVVEVVTPAAPAEAVTPDTPAVTPATPADVAKVVTPAEAVDVVASAPAAAAPVAVTPEVSNEKADRGEFSEPTESDVVNNDSNVSADEDHRASDVGNGSDPAETSELPTPTDTLDTPAVAPAATAAG